MSLCVIMLPKGGFFFHVLLCPFSLIVLSCICLVVCPFLSWFPLVPFPKRSCNKTGVRWPRPAYKGLTTRAPLPCWRRPSGCWTQSQVWMQMQSCSSCWQLGAKTSSVLSGCRTHTDRGAQLWWLTRKAHNSVCTPKWGSESVFSVWHFARKRLAAGCSFCLTSSTDAKLHNDVDFNSWRLFMFGETV